MSRRLRIAAGTSAAVVVAAVPATAATTGWGPFDEPGRRAPRPTVAHLPPASSLTSQLAVLRRPRTAADRSAPVRAALRAFDDESHDVQVESIRLLPGGAVLVPVKRFEPRGPDGPRREDRKDDAACLYTPDSGGTGGSACFTPAQVHAGKAIGSQGSVVDGIVPDGVARVRLTSPPGSGEATVRDNYFAARLPRIQDAFGGFVRADGAQWFDANGRRIATIDYTRP